MHTTDYSFKNVSILTLTAVDNITFYDFCICQHW